ncbi:unnamed protein product [Colias eurytheme]|nr:unnamed protein product [Colias eurytheme]
MENADEFDGECSEYVTFAPSVLQLEKSGTVRRSATERCIQVHYFRSVAAAERPDRAPDLRIYERPSRRVRAARRAICYDIILCHGKM